MVAQDEDKLMGAVSLGKKWVKIGPLPLVPGRKSDRSIGATTAFLSRWRFPGCPEATGSGIKEREAK